ncbi:hypothetical protein [Nonlabens antarcticus]|uniref:hypothetical protein n=1 Tax=Nonlabens antarcticus TaxID=392714 RepID=UPI001890C6F0|nr:hypothetical protein [Nonlabens antarcticus]
MGQHFQSLTFNSAAVVQVPVNILVAVKKDTENYYAFAKAETLSTYYASRPPPVTC